MSQVWEHQVSGTDQAVLLVLADYARDDGSRCYPCVKTLIYKVGKSRRPIQRVLDKLRRKGVLKVVKQGRGRGNTTVYQIDLSALPIKGPPPLEND